MASNKYYSNWDMGKTYFRGSRRLEQHLLALPGKINRIFERAFHGFNDSVWADYKRRCAIYDAEQAMKKATNNTPVVDNCASIVELACANVGEVVPTTEAHVDLPVADVVVVAIEDAMVVEAQVSPNEVEVPTNEVVIDFNVTDDIADATVHAEVVDVEVFPKVEALVDIPDAHDTGVFDTPNPAPIRPMVDIDIVEGGGILKHEFVDPYLEQVDAYHDLHFYVASQDVIPISLKPCAFSHVSLVKNGVTHYYDIDTKLFIRVNFDPGIFLGFIVEYHGVRLDGADFYDIMLIRGRILSKRERMI